MPGSSSLYPEAEGQSSPERPPARRAGRALPRALARATVWLLGVVTFLLLSAYAIGGRSFFRRLVQLRTRAFTRIEESLQPPTQAELAAAAARAARDTASVMAEDKPASASATLIVSGIAIVIILAVSAFYLSGRRARARAGR